MPAHDAKLEVGDRVFHVGQEWARSLIGGTAKITGVEETRWGFEYTVLAGEDFSRHTGPDNPEVRVAQWSSQMTHIAMVRCYRCSLCGRLVDVSYEGKKAAPHLHRSQVCMGANHPALPGKRFPK